MEPDVLITVLKDLGLERCSIMSVGGDIPADAYLASTAELWTGMGGEG